MIDGLVQKTGQGGARPRREAAAAADDVRRGDGAIRPRCAGPAVRPGAGRLHRPGGEERLPRVFERGGKRRPRAGDQRQEGRPSIIRAAASTRSPSTSAGFGAKGLAWFRVEADGTLTSTIAKNFTPELLKEFGTRLKAEPGDLLLFVADQWKVTCKALYALRTQDRRGDEALRSEGDALFVGRRVPDVRLRRRGEALGGDAPSVHVAARPGFRDCWSPTRASAGRRRTTW